jgi:tetratricopeptide (TPR) repeat protein
VDAKHLTSDEILLVADSRARDQVDRNGTIPEGMRSHAESCEACRRLVSMQVEFSRKLDQIRSSNPSSTGPDCFDPETLWRLALGLLLPDQTILILNHAAQCDHCGNLFRSAIEEFESDLSHEQQNLLNTVQAARDTDQPNMVRELASLTQSRPAKKLSERKSARLQWFGRVVIATSSVAAVVLITVFAVQAVRRSRPSYAEGLIAQAYTSARPFEPRLRGAAFGPITIERGGGRSQTERPPALLEAEALIGRKLSKFPNDPDWLRARGQADLLDGHYGLAINAFQRALDLQPRSPELEVDLATALFQKAQAEISSPDLAEAADLLSKVIQTHPTDKIAIFNRAMVLEHMFLFDQASDDWEQYLKLDGSGEWAGEATQHLADIKRRFQKKSDRGERPLLAPAELGMGNLVANSAQLSNVQLRIEEYLGVILRQWPTRAFDSLQKNGTQLSPDLEAEGLRNIANILNHTNGDSWLMEFLSARPTLHFDKGLQELRTAILSSDRADYPASLRHANEAQRQFHLDGNIAGILRAKFQRVYALQFSNNGLDCSREAQLLQNELQGRHYAWIRQQAMIEEGICRNLLGEFGSASLILESVGSEAARSHFAVTRIRASVMAALVFWDSGEPALAWGKLDEAARYCWNEYCPDGTLYGVYANMDNFAEDSLLWFVQVFTARQAVAIAKADPDLLMRAVEHSRLASAAALAGFPRLARDNFEIANRLLAETPHSEVTANYEAGINIDLAKLALGEGDSRSAEHYLELAEARIPFIVDYYLLTDFFLTKAKVEAKANADSPADASLQWALALAERQLASLLSQKDRFMWSRHNAGVYRELVDRDLKKGDVRGALEKWEWFLAAPRRVSSARDLSNMTSSATPDVFALNRQMAAPPPLPRMMRVDELSSRLRGQTMISYVIISNRLGAWILDDRGVDFRWLTSDANYVSRMVRNFVELCSSPSADRSSWAKQGKTLYEVLISPLEDRLPHDRSLLIDGEPEILGVPFAALTDLQGHHLLEKFPISLIPGTYLLPSEGVVDSIDSSNEALIVDSVSFPLEAIGLHPLPPSLSESKLVASKFHSSRIFRGNDLRLATLKREIPNSVVFHYTGHSSPDEGLPGVFVSGGKTAHESEILDSSFLYLYNLCMTQETSLLSHT